MARSNSVIWIVAFMEGFSTLAVEVIAIRLAIPVVGSSMTLTGVVLGVVLFALSAGYWRGGELSSRWENQRTRAVLTRNLLLAGIVYAAISFPLEAWLLEKMLDADLSLGLAIGVKAVLLFVLPVYLASQTVPMLAELINTEGKAGKASGKVLFFSTLGSVAGGIVTPVFLFPYFGVRVSTYVVCGCLVGAAGLMAIGLHPASRIVTAAVAVLAVVWLSSFLSKPDHVLYSLESPYNSIRVIEDQTDDGRTERVLMMSGSRSSGIYADDRETSFPYTREVGKVLAASGSRNVLVIGAAGFTVPRDAARLPFVERVDTVDVDPVVREVTEQHFLQQQLSPKVRFFPLSARYAMRKSRREGKRYGFAFVDAYFGKGIPDELLTVEFFSDVRAVSDTTAANVIMDRDLESNFARNVLASFRQAFGRAFVKDVKPGDDELTNFLVSDRQLGGSIEWNGSGKAYTDNRNSAGRDHVKLVWGGN